MADGGIPILRLNQPLLLPAAGPTSCGPLALHPTVTSGALYLFSHTSKEIRMTAFAGRMAVWGTGSAALGPDSQTTTPSLEGVSFLSGGDPVVVRARRVTQRTNPPKLAQMSTRPPPWGDVPHVPWGHLISTNKQ